MKLAHSNDTTMREIERNAARDDGELRLCELCGAENIVDDPDCPRDGIMCRIVTIAPMTGTDPS